MKFRWHIDIAKLFAGSDTGKIGLDCLDALVREPIIGEVALGGNVLTTDGCARTALSNLLVSRPESCKLSLGASHWLLKCHVQDIRIAMPCTNGGRPLIQKAQSLVAAS